MPLRLALCFVLCALLPAAAAAQPKVDTLRQCSANQLATPEGQRCFAAQAEDGVAGRSTVHAPHCAASGAILCCLVDPASAVVKGSCEVIGAVPPAHARPAASGELQPGVAGD